MHIFYVNEILIDHVKGNSKHFLQGELTETPVKRALYGELQLPFKHSYIDGEIYPPFIKEKSLENSRNFDIRDGDIFIATYPKNGTTWTQKIIQNLHKIHGTGSDFEHKKLYFLQIWVEHDELLYGELSHLTIIYISQKQLPRKMKSHVVSTECAGYIFW